MIVPKSQDAIHRMYLLRILMAIVDDPAVSSRLVFKGGTAAVLAGWLDRFSLDLDFDLIGEGKSQPILARLGKLIDECGLKIKQRSRNGTFMVLSYPALTGGRNTLKVSIMTTYIVANQYTPIYLADINRYATCQTRDTMVANKLVAPMDRWEKHRTIAGRDIYDIHYFLSHGYAFRGDIIRQRRGVDASVYLEQLITFITDRVTDRILTEDLNYLLPPARFQIIRKILKADTLLLLRSVRDGRVFRS